MREATSTSSSSRVVLTIPLCHIVWQIQAVGRRRSYSNLPELQERIRSLFGDKGYPEKCGNPVNAAMVCRLGRWPGSPEPAGDRQEALGGSPWVWRCQR